MRWTALVLYFFAAAALAVVQGARVDYTVDGRHFTGWMAWDDAIAGRRPGVLVVHEWWGHNAYARRRAEMLAEAGYTAFALDMYGEGRTAGHPDDARRFMQAVLADLPAAERRFRAARAVLARHPTVDPGRIAAIGYCFGGGIVLHMARVGEDLDGVVSFHGSLGTDRPAGPGAVKARVLVFTGGDDPFAPPELVRAFEEEMRAAGARLELHVYPGVKHSFTNPEADALAARFGMPLAYDRAADRDSWRRTLAFLGEVFAR